MTLNVLPLKVVARQPGSEANLGPYINVVTWTLLTTSALAVMTRIVTKKAMGRKIDIDDAFIIGALATSIGSGIACSIQSSNGLGKDIRYLNESHIIAFQKSEYASKLLYLATLTLAKLSIISLLMILTASDLHRKLGITIAVFIALWGFISEFVAAFQCECHTPWEIIGPNRKRYDLVAFWKTMCVVNMLTDLALIMFPVHIMLTLQMNSRKKVTIITFFGARSLDIVATAIQLAYTPGFASPNPTRDLWKWSLMTQVIQCITILTSCIPYLRPLLESIPSGMYGADELRRRGTSSDSYGRSRSGASYKLTSTNGTSTKNDSKSKSSRKLQNERCLKRYLLPMLSEDVGPTTHANSASGLPGGPRRTDGVIGVEITAETGFKSSDGKWESESTGSLAKIVKTTVVSAEWEELDVSDRRESRETGDEIEVLRD
ncbi:hypothetical protein BS50DRAFT_664532 [Corynespora cassiicola Philippines]|uniref:Rhodopsin domain-containing protein n=1 Tax=Corynespora cassiicola Philippines TaxID=1448308 RepID=A0A2T2NW62_CORCC|nr:hypothetical protein BS50DRAFT_664532 [Corynespora cassiicola Philippines]